MRSKRSLEGYFYRFDPNGRGSGVEEYATLTCAHCHRQILLNPQRRRARNWCRACDKYICDAPSCNAGCLPLLKSFDLLEPVARRNNGLIESHIRLLRESILGSRALS